MYLNLYMSKNIIANTKLQLVFIMQWIIVRGGLYYKNSARLHPSHMTKMT